MMYKKIRKNEEVLALLECGNRNLNKRGITDHSEIHCEVVAQRAAYILEKLGYDEHTIDMAKIAGFMHDIGNAINRSRHAEYGAILANSILKEMNLPVRDRINIVSAIGNHDESTGGANDVISAALIIADKTDVRRERVQVEDKSSFDLHDRVNYAVTGTKLRVDKEKKSIVLNLQIDETICTMYEYFDIFLGRMILCRGAADVLGMRFKLNVNGRKAL